MSSIAEWPWQYLIVTSAAALFITLYEVFASTRSFWYSLNHSYLVYLVFNLAIYIVSVVTLRLTFFSGSTMIPTVFAGLLIARGVVQQLLEDVARDVLSDLDAVRTLRRKLHARVVETANFKKARAEERKAHKLAVQIANAHADDESTLKHLALSTVEDPDEREKRRKLLENEPDDVSDETKATMNYILSRIIVSHDFNAAHIHCDRRKGVVKHLKRERRRKKRNRT